MVMVEWKLIARSRPNEILCLKILVAEDAQGKVWLGYIRPSYLQRRRNLSSHLMQNVAVVDTRAAATTE